MAVDADNDAIRAASLAKSFAALRAVDGVDLRVARGESVALFGPNGAGKTTLIRLLSLALKPSAGSLRIHGRDPRRQDLEIRGEIGVISHQSYLYDDLSARENLRFFAALYGVPDPAGRADALLDLVELRSRADDAVGTFSRGMQQRVSFARSLVHDPRLLFLDEPFTGLDPHAAGTLRRTLARLREDGRSVVLSTHNLGQGLDLSDRWVILHRGRILDSGDSPGVDPLAFERDYFERIAAREGARA